MSTNDTTARLSAAGFRPDGSYWYAPNGLGPLDVRDAVQVLALVEQARAEARAAALAEAVRAVEAVRDETQTRVNRAHGEQPYPGWFQGVAVALAAIEALPASPSAAPVEPAPLLRMTPDELLRRGGPWLGAARNWLQWNTRGQDGVTWGSAVEIRPPMTFASAEDFAAHVAASLWPVGAPPSVLDAARALTRWHYGDAPGQGVGAPKDCVLVDREQWIALHRAVEGHLAPAPLPPTSSEAFAVWQARLDFGAAVIAWQDAHRDCAGSLLYEHGRLVCHGCGATREQPPPPRFPAAPASPESATDRRAVGRVDVPGARAH